MPNCQTCGVSMTASERVFNRKGVAGNWHFDCEYAEHIRDVSVPSNLSSVTGFKAITTKFVSKLTNRRLSQAGTPATAPTGTIAAGTNLGIGAYKYAYTNFSLDGESLPSPASGTITTTTGNQLVNVAGIVAGPAGTTKRKLYRTLVGGSIYFLITTINDNTTLIYADSITDVVAGANPQVPQFTTFVGGEFP